MRLGLGINGRVWVWLLRPALLGVRGLAWGSGDGWLLPALLGIRGLAWGPGDGWLLPALLGICGLLPGLLPAVVSMPFRRILARVLLRRFAGVWAGLFRFRRIAQEGAFPAAICATA